MISFLFSPPFFVQILMPVFPGQLRYIRKNLFHAVFVLDPATICGLEVSLVSNVLIFLLRFTLLARFLIIFWLFYCCCGILQSIDMIMSLYENNFPMRFGVILYSSKFVKQIEMNSDEISSSAKQNDSQNKEDISSLVITVSNFVLLVCKDFNLEWATVHFHSLCCLHKAWYVIYIYIW